MTPKAMASTFRKRAGMCKATTKFKRVQPLRSVQGGWNSLNVWNILNILNPL